MVGPGRWPVRPSHHSRRGQAGAVLLRQRRPGQSHPGSHGRRSRARAALEEQARDEADLPASRCSAPAAALHKGRASQVDYPR
jgi:hypothetical protein